MAAPRVVNVLAEEARRAVLDDSDSLQERPTVHDGSSSRKIKNIRPSTRVMLRISITCVVHIQENVPTKPFETIRDNECQHTVQNQFSVGWNRGGGACGSRVKPMDPRLVLTAVKDILELVPECLARVPHTEFVNEESEKQDSFVDVCKTEEAIS